MHRGAFLCLFVYALVKTGHFFNAIFRENYPSASNQKLTGSVVLFRDEAILGP